MPPENKFSFTPLSDKEKAENKRQDKEINDSIRSASDRAIACLTSDSFREFKEEYQRGERALIDIGIELSLADPIHYAVAAHAIFGQLKVLRVLLDGVEKARVTK